MPKSNLDNMNQVDSSDKQLKTAENNQWVSTANVDEVKSESTEKSATDNEWISTNKNV